MAIASARKATVPIDIWAYSGLFALAAVRINPAINFYAYEILTESFLTLYSNVFRHKMIGRLKPRLCVLADRAGTVTLPTSFATGVLPTSISLGWKFAEGTDVPLSTPGELHSDVREPMVIDVEGIEIEVIESGRKLLERARPRIICKALRRAQLIDDPVALLRSFGY